ncbi:serine/threonine protein kinase [Candidatus Uabimicrobium amorphum]|nr:serine/threonine-protein kinase [Candidatus Uabimicrobium amorphum]
MTKVLGKYKILEELGRGGMGVVYRAYDIHLQRDCAIKVLLPEAMDNQRAIQRFKSEALAVAKINHPNIIQIFEVHQQKPYFFVMNYVEGIPLDKHLEKIDLQQKLHLFSKICLAVAFAHKKSILHRDLKPANILVTKDGQPIIVDFGIARNIEHTTGLTKTGDLIGTPKYMSPEAARGDSVDERSDLYSLGVILYQMLTGNVPFIGDNVVELLFHLTTQDPIPPSRINPKVARESDIEIVCLKALEKKPQKRIASAQMFYDEIKNILHNRPISLKPPSLWQKACNLYRKNYIVFSVVLILITTPIYFYLVERSYTASLKTSYINTKCDFIDGTLEAIYTQRRSLDVQNAYKKIEKCYEYLTEIMEAIPPQKTQQISRRINSHLKFLILTNFPQITQKKIPDDFAIRTRISLSPDGQLLAKLYYDKKFYTSIWKKTSHETLDELVKLPCANEKVKIAQFSPDNRFVVYRNPQHFLTIFDLQRKKNIFKYKDGLPIHTQFVEGSRYVIFPAFEQKYQWYIFDTQTQNLQKLLETDKPEKALVSADAKFLIIGTVDNILIYDLPQRRLHAKKPTLTRRSYQMVVSRNSKNLFILAMINAFVIDLQNPEKVLKRATKYISQKSMPPLATGNSRFLFSDERGNLNVLYAEKNKLNITSKIQHNDGVIEEGYFAPDNFVILSKGSTIEVQNLDVKDLITTLKMPSRMEDAQVELNDNGLHVTVAMQNLVNEYTFPFTKLTIQDPTLRSLIKIEKKGRSSVDLLKKLIVSDNMVLHANDFAFVVWYDNKFFFQKFWEASTHMLFHEKTKQLHVFFKNMVKIYDYQNGKVLGQYKVLLPKEEQINQVLFSKDGKNLYITMFNKYSQKYRLVKQNIAGSLINEISSIKYKGSVIHELQDHLIIGLAEDLRNNGEFCIIKPSGETVYMSQITEKVRHDQISAIAVSDNQQFLVVGDVTGKITIWKNAVEPQLVTSLQTVAGIERIIIDPNSTYCSFFTQNNIYICDLRNPLRLFTIYRGHHKFGKSTFNRSWTKAYLPDASHEILVFDQDYFVDDDTFIKKLRYCDSALSNTTDLATYVNMVKKHLRKHNK